MVQLEIWNYYKHDREKIYDEKTNMRYWHSIIMTSTSLWHLFMRITNISENQNEHKPESKSLNCIENFDLKRYTRQNIELMIMHKQNTYLYFSHQHENQPFCLLQRRQNWKVIHQGLDSQRVSISMGPLVSL